MELSISGKSEGLVAAGGSYFFNLFDGSITQHLARALRPLKTAGKPFEMLGLFVNAKPAEYVGKRGVVDALAIKESRSLLTFRTGHSLKVFDITLTTASFYTCSISEKKVKAAEAFRLIADKLESSYGASVADVADAIRNAARHFLEEDNEALVAAYVGKSGAELGRLIEPPSK